MRTATSTPSAPVMPVAWPVTKRIKPVKKRFPSILDELKAEFPQFLKKGLTENPMKCEYFLPAVVSNLLEADRATAAVLPSADKWYGVTYKEDKPVVVEAIRNLKKEGLYPENLWEE